MIQLKVDLISEPMSCFSNYEYGHTFTELLEKQGYCYLTMDKLAEEVNIMQVYDLSQITNGTGFVSISAGVGEEVLDDGEQFCGAPHCWILPTNYYFKVLEAL